MTGGMLNSFQEEFTWQNHDQKLREVVWDNLINCRDRYIECQLFRAEGCLKRTQFLVNNKHSCIVNLVQSIRTGEGGLNSGDKLRTFLNVMN